MKIQKGAIKIKNKLSPKEYLNIQPAGSSPEKFYGTAKKHKPTRTGIIDDLPIHPTISNLRTALYQLAKHLAKLLSPLHESEYKIGNNIEFIDNIKPVSHEVTSQS